jgi:hypothetical protein
MSLLPFPTRLTVYNLDFYWSIVLATMCLSKLLNFFCTVFALMDFNFFVFFLKTTDAKF